MKVSVSLISFVSIATLLDGVTSDRVNCKVIPFETKDGLSGTCCVFFNKNTTQFPKEEVTKQILSDKSNDNKRQSNLPNRSEPNLPNRSEPKFPNQNRGEEGKVVFMDDQKPNLQNKTMTPTNGQNQNKPSTNVTISNKNAFDTPEKCPEGKLRDHTGACTQPF